MESRRESQPVLLTLLTIDGLDALIRLLREEGYQVVGPTVRDEAIVYEELRGVSDLPVGVTDEQNGGQYRLKPRADKALFGYNVGPHSWKKFPFPAKRRLWKAERRGKRLTFAEEELPQARYAFLGVRACELSALAIQDRVFLAEGNRDSYYARVRENAFVIAVNCTQAGNTCFCASMGTGPRASFGFDLALTEILEETRHAFFVEVGTEKGREILSSLPTEAAGAGDPAKVDAIVERTRSQMGRRMVPEVRNLLARNLEHPRWEEVAKRCLNCANCTLACPTCFCSTVQDTSDLKGDHTERWRNWDSCFHLDFSYLHGGSVRTSAASRYRQWMTHKLSSWHDQFGTTGCVGCGRCITWCPVGIDITEEAAAISQSESKAGDRL